MQQSQQLVSEQEIRDILANWAQAVEGMGFDHVIAVDCHRNRQAAPGRAGGHHHGQPRQRCVVAGSDRRTV